MANNPRGPLTLIAPAARLDAVNAALNGVWINQSGRLGSNELSVPLTRGASSVVTHYGTDWTLTVGEYNNLTESIGHIPGLTLDRRPFDDALAAANPPYHKKDTAAAVAPGR